MPRKRRSVFSVSTNKMKRHVNIPIFIPHLGCPNTCVFCNQRKISGVTEFNIDGVRRQIDTALSTVTSGQSVEIAFFGGSFTGIDRSLMTELLKIAYEYVKAGRVESVRCSTRPDYIDREVLSILREYGVTTVELGLQSVSEEVLSLTKRGHTARDAERASRLILEYGFQLVGQMMIGLPGSSLDTELDTAKFIIDVGAKYARIYPTVVFLDTELCEMALKGKYTPLDLDTAITRSAAVTRLFIDGGVDVIRTGLCASENLISEESYFAGPNHSAIGELVMGEVYYGIIRDSIRNLGAFSGKVTLMYKNGSLSKLIGQKKKNIIRLRKEYPEVRLELIPCDTLSEYQVIIKSKKEEFQCT